MPEPFGYVPNQRYGDLPWFRQPAWDILHPPTTGSVLTHTGVARTGPVWGLPADLTISGQAQGDILYFNGTNWVRLAAGTAQQALITAGSGANPFWGPNAWSTYAPTITASVGAFTTVSATGRYWAMGKILHLQVEITITLAGTAASVIQCPLPGSYTSKAFVVLPGRDNGITGSMLQAFVGSGQGSLNILDYKNASVIATGGDIIIAGSFEIA